MLCYSQGAENNDKEKVLEKAEKTHVSSKGGDIGMSVDGTQKPRGPKDDGRAHLNTNRGETSTQNSISNKTKGKIKTFKAKSAQEVCCHVRIEVLWPKGY